MAGRVVPATLPLLTTSFMELLPVFTPNADGEQQLNIKYLPGSPRQIRFDAKAGQFNINGKELLGPTLTFQPIA